ncbi:MAG: flagellar M-ring protein FliF C-terminal domain-containing protein [Vulcanimicrobiaceae bacterium]
MTVLLERWRRLGKARRLALALLALATGLALAVSAFYERDTRVSLFAAPLRSEQVGEVVELLAEWNVPFVATSDNVRVDLRHRNELLLRLSLAGAPHQHLESSSEVLAKAGPLTPQSVLDAQEREGLAGDLAAGLRGLQGVADARVIVAPAREAAYADESSRDASASVRISLQPGATLSRGAVEGIRQFVAAGVPGLEPKRVAIVDDRGLALAEDASAPAADESQALQQSLQSALDQALGAGATIVRVHAAYDARSREVREIVRKPFGSRPIGSTTLEERYQSANKHYAKVHASEDRGSDFEDERIDVPAGRLERISVAVAVDSTRRLDLGKIRSLAVATLGIDPGRGDSLSVEEVPFVKAPARGLVPRSAIAFGLLAELLPTLLLAAALLLAGRWGAKPLAVALERCSQRFSLRKAARAVAGFAPAQVRGALEKEPPHTAAAIISALPAATATAVLELYPPEERAAIVNRMARAAAPVVPDYETLLRRG